MEAAHHGREARTEVALHLKAGRKPSEGEGGRVGSGTQG